jgi:hypothetical protein
MVLEYYGTTVSSEEIYAFVIKDADGGSFLTELARFARSRGFGADCFAYNLHLTEPHDVALPPSVIADKLEEKQQQLADQWYLPMLTSTILCIRSGAR